MILLDEITRQLHADLHRRTALLSEPLAAAVNEQAVDLLGVLLLRYEDADIPREHRLLVLQFLTLDIWPVVLERVGLLAAHAVGADPRQIDRVCAAMAARRGDRGMPTGMIRWRVA